jgi:hypothetical protein
MDSLFSLFIVACCVLVAVSTITRRGKFGVNFQPISCPKCATDIPFSRMPANKGQALWGGYTCGNCKTEIDKWGNEVQLLKRK